MVHLESFDPLRVRDKFSFLSDQSKQLDSPSELNLVEIDLEVILLESIE